MKKIVYLILLISVYFFNNFTIKALKYGGCEYSEISKLKSYVSNVNISYDYYIFDNSAYFDITISNVVPGLYFIDSVTGNKYYYDDTLDGEITLTGIRNTSGQYTFYSSLNECYGIKLGSKYYTLPIYNIYYNDSLCIENRNYSLCQKWTEVPYSYDKFSEMIDEYNKSKEETVIDDNNGKVDYKKSYLDIFVEFYVKYYYILLLGVIGICITIMIITRRKNRFDL